MYKVIFFIGIYIVTLLVKMCIIHFDRKKKLASRAGVGKGHYVKDRMKVINGREKFTLINAREMYTRMTQQNMHFQCGRDADRK